MIDGYRERLREREVLVFLNKHNFILLRAAQKLQTIQEIYAGQAKPALRQEYRTCVSSRSACLRVEGCVLLKVIVHVHGQENKHMTAEKERVRCNLILEQRH